MMSFAPLALTAATAAMVAVPLLPVAFELRRRQDAAPLPTRTDDGHIENFAASFVARLEPLADLIAECALAGSTRLVSLADGSKALLLGSPTALGELRVLTRRNHITAAIFCWEGRTLPGAEQITTDVYSAGDLETGPGCGFRALYCRGSAHLGPHTSIFRWVHASDVLSFGKGSELYGRASSAHSLHLAMGCRFERVHAPAVLIGCDALPSELQRPSHYAGRSIMDIKLGRVLAGGDFRLDCGDVLQGHVIAAGSVWLGAGSRVLGSLKSRHHAHIGRGSEIQGAVVSSTGLDVAGASHIRGPVIAEGELTIGPETQIGSPEAPTSVSAPRIRMAPGSVVYGTLWARDEGRVDEEKES